MQLVSPSSFHAVKRPITSSFSFLVTSFGCLVVFHRFGVDHPAYARGDTVMVASYHVAGSGLDGVDSLSGRRLVVKTPFLWRLYQPTSDDPTIDLLLERLEHV